jgi:SulP family sulfate permease
MAATVIVVVVTHDLARGVFVGVLMSALFFARKISRLMSVESKLDKEGAERVYRVYGQVFFASAESFSSAFDFKEAVERVVIDLTEAHFWDISAVSVLDRVVLKFRREGATVELVGLNKASATIIDRFAVHDKADALERMMNH